MRMISWNVNGIRAVVKKNFQDVVDELSPDILCIQETKAQDDQVQEAIQHIDGYHVYSNSAVKKGYSGTAVLSKTEPINITKGLGIREHDDEGRVLTLEYADFFLVNVYTPNSGSELKRLSYRQEWDLAFAEHIKSLKGDKAVLVCGDLNVAHTEMDLARPKPNYNKSAGYMQEEIDGFDRLEEYGFVDTFRHHHPDKQQYSWWSFRGQARANNVGWRIDYWLCDKDHAGQVKGAYIHDHIPGSDHCPVGIEWN